MPNRVTIQIAGQHYTMLAEESEEYMNEVAELAQQTIAECGGSAAFATTRSLALATVNLADEYIKAKKQAEAAEAKLRVAESENEALRSQLERSRNPHNNNQHRK
ncbi:cell division protein ZapA [Agathobaculum sp.]|uniref:cell division protein ZapA n=1 Tax=Agathobaculum sp. TaxID=2048138 RepID=UPI002A8178E4|nr:cell division protein ZapA [Agathobaculum sp.]MDY3618613.1 cell division protein ZapA [Agathobaculum sp.]